MTNAGRVISHRQRLGRLAYALLFIAALPVALVVWARRLDMLLPIAGLESLPFGMAIATAGALLALYATLLLWLRGGGMPASPYPPQRLVTSGPYRLFAHPIYIGVVGIALGVALVTGSASGMWIVTPMLAAAAAAWVLGFERDLTGRHFGRLVAPAIRLAPESDASPTRVQRVSIYVLVFAPWLALYMGVELLGVPSDAWSTYMSWEQSLPVWPWTEAVYAAVYPFVLLAPLAARRQRDLRAFAVDALWAGALIFPLYLLLPFVAEARAIPGYGFWQSVMRVERAADGPVTAFPAYHLVWAAIAARAWIARWPRARAVMVLWIGAIAGSCVTTGMHSIADVAAGCAAFVVVRRRGDVGRLVQRVTEAIANSWRERILGPVRLLNHGIYAGVGAGLGVGVAVTIAGPSQLAWLVVLTATAIVGAGIWAQLVEGSPQLLRPYGYFGSVLAVVAVLTLAGAAGVEVWQTASAFCVGSTITYAAGRLRCLVQGCCHGTPTSCAMGIAYRHPRSRVVRLSEYAGVPLHPTPLYSALWMLLVGVVLLRLWSLAVPLPFIVGTYFMLTGLGRFVEEHYRGEPQTLVLGGLRLYQWLAIASLIGGAAITSMPGPAAPALAGFRPRVIPALLVVSIAAYLAYGVDFPRSNRRFSRLV